MVHGIDGMARNGKRSGGTAGRTARLTRRAFVARMAGIAAMGAAAFLVLAAAGCTPEPTGNAGLQNGLPDWADADELVEQTRSLIELYSGRNFEGVAQACPALGLTAEDYASTGDKAIDQLGSLEGYGDHAFMQGADQTGRAYAVVVQIADYANGKAQYTVSFYEDGTVCGFYIK